MPALVPLAMDFLMAVGAVVFGSRIGTRINPVILWVVCGRQRVKEQAERLDIERGAGDEEARFRSGDPARVRIARQEEAAGAIADGVLGAPLETNKGSFNRVL